MRVLTIPPTDEGWVALQPELCGDRRCCFGGPSHMVAPAAPAAGDVLGLVELADVCVGSVDHALTGFVWVVEVRKMWEGHHRQVFVSQPDGRDPVHLHDLPNAVPGGVAIRVEPCDCPTCEGLGRVNHRQRTRPGAAIFDSDPCPTCSDLPRPVALHGDAPIQGVEL